MPVVITGKGWRATVRPQAKNAFSRLLVTNLLDLANIFSENYHCEDIYTYLKAIVKNLLGLANIFSAKFCFCFHSANCHINDFARFVTKKTLSRLTVVIIFFVPCDDNYDCVNFKGCHFCSRFKYCCTVTYNSLESSFCLMHVFIYARGEIFFFVHCIVD